MNEEAPGKQPNSVEAAKDRKPDWHSLGLWRFGGVFLAAVLTFIALGICGGVLSVLMPSETGAPSSGDTVRALTVFSILFALSAAISVCVLPIAAGEFWKAQSKFLGRFGNRDFYVYLPAGTWGWVGYYLATLLSATCCIVLFLAIFGVAAASGNMGKRCPFCRSEIPFTARVCPQCRSSVT